MKSQSSPEYDVMILCAMLREKGSSDFPLNQTFSSHTQPLGVATRLVLLLTVSPCLAAYVGDSTCSSETADAHARLNLCFSHML